MKLDILIIYPTIYKELDDNGYILQCIYKIRQQHSNVAKCFTQSSALLFAICCYLTFTFMHLADAFIQSNLQLHSGYTFSLVHVFPGNRTHNIIIFIMILKLCLMFGCCLLTQVKGVHQQVFKYASRQCRWDVCHLCATFSIFLANK